MKRTITNIDLQYVSFVRRPINPDCIITEIGRSTPLPNVKSNSLASTEAKQ